MDGLIRLLQRPLLIVGCVVLAACGGYERIPAEARRDLVRVEATPAIAWPELGGVMPPAPTGPGPHPVVLLGHGVTDDGLLRFARLAKADVKASRTTPHGLLLDLAILRRNEWEVPPEERRRKPGRRLQFITPGPTFYESIELAGEPWEPEYEPWRGLPADAIVFDVREPPKQTAPEPKGLLMCYHSLGGLQYEEAALQELQRRGWLVAVAGFPWGTSDPGLFAVMPGAEGSSAQELARLVDGRIARAAFAAQAVREYLLEAHPRLGERPLVVWGASAGSFAALATAARLEASQRVDAIVLIGAGANLLEVSQKSTFFDGGIKIVAMESARAAGPSSTGGARIHRLGSKGDLGQPNGALTGVLDRLVEEYARRSALDPGTLAARFASTPVLMLHASADEIVPASTGDRLWELLGKPERWVFDTGHQLLFWRLSTFKADLGDWIDRAALGGGAPVADGPSGESPEDSGDSGDPGTNRR